MAFALSSGPFQYNRFDVLNEKKADKDYDGDGKVESGKAEYFGSKDKAIKKATGKCKGDCDGGCDECSSKKEEFASDVQSLIDEGIDLSGYTWDGLYQEYITEGLPPALLQAIMKKKMGKGKKEVKEGYMNEDITSEKGKAKMKSMIDARTTDSGRAKSGKGQNVKDINHIGRANVDNLGGTPPNLKIAKNPVKSRSYGGTGNKAARRASNLAKEEVTITKEMVVEYLVSQGYASNEVSAEILHTHVSDEFLEEIESNISEGFMPLPKEKMARQSDKAYGKEQQAVKSGDAAGANKQMQRRIAMNDPSSRKTGLLNKNANK